MLFSSTLPLQPLFPKSMTLLLHSLFPKSLELLLQPLFPKLLKLLLLLLHLLLRERRARVAPRGPRSRDHWMEKRQEVGVETACKAG